MTKRSFAPYAAPVTWFKNKIRTDAFFVARLKILGLYFVIGVAMFVGIGLLSDYSLRYVVYHIAVSQNGEPVRTAFQALREDLWIDRLSTIALFGIVAFFITEFVFRPIKKSAEIQKRFIAIVSHELRTPLTIMKNASEIGLRNSVTLSREKAISIIESNLEEANRMSDTINFLLAFAVLGERNKAISIQEVLLEKIAEEVLAVLRTRHESRHVSLVLSAETSGKIRGDDTALKGMLFNLVENAILHTPADGVVTVSIKKRGGSVILAVQDRGKGISKEDLPYIFEPFFRGEEADHPDESLKRMGLGLSLVKGVAELHHATVHVSSSKGKGSVFSVTFP